MATDCLKQLVEDESKNVSPAPETLTNNFNVDDPVHARNRICLLICLLSYF
jgi:hypothetical protein